MTRTMNDLATALVGTEASPFFVTILTNTEFDQDPTTVAAFTTLEDAEAFAELMRQDGSDGVLVEGPQGTYLELTRDSRLSFITPGKVSISTPEGKETFTTH
jgi:hypothetical protein